MAEPVSPTSGKKRRATQACTCCRRRKVRCDVAIKGTPCTNCSMDKASCQIAENRRKRPRPHQVSAVDVDVATFAALTPCLLDDVPQDDSPVHDAAAGVTLATPVEQALINDVVGGQSLPSPAADASFDGGLCTRSASEHTIELPPSVQTMRQPQTNMDFLYGKTARKDSLGEGLVATTITGPPTVIYSFYPFATLGSLSSCRVQDVNFLQLEGCLHLPTRYILNEIFHHYFLHVHPLLPILDEREIWDAFRGEGASREPRAGISLLLLQAIIFVSVNFLSLDAVNCLGFRTSRDAKGSFYRRAKLLYDLGAEDCPIAIAQSALLLTYWVSPPCVKLKPNTMWLLTAIQNARAAGADQACRPRSRSLTSVKTRRGATLRRLWWCCLIRDRIMPLGLRRSIQITRAQFDFSTALRPSEADLGDGAGTSVHDSETQRELSRIRLKLLELCVLLTEPLEVLYPIDGTAHYETSTTSVLKTSQATLKDWYTANLADLHEKSHGSVHKSIITCNNHMNIYYQAARLAISHHQSLGYAARSRGPAAPRNRQDSVAEEIIAEIQDATAHLTKSMECLNRKRLTRWLTISPIAYTAFPLALHLIDLHFSAAHKAACNKGTTDAKRDPSILVEAMRTFHSQYDGVDWVAQIIRTILHAVQRDTELHTHAAEITSWKDLLISWPQRYLKLWVMMELSMRGGDVATEDHASLLMSMLTLQDEEEGDAPPPGLMARQGRNPAGVLDTQERQWGSGLWQPQQLLHETATAGLFPLGGTVANVLPTGGINPAALVGGLNGDLPEFSLAPSLATSDEPTSANVAVPVGGDDHQVADNEVSCALAVTQQLPSSGMLDALSALIQSQSQSQHQNQKQPAAVAGLDFSVGAHHQNFNDAIISDVWDTFEVEEEPSPITSVSSGDHEDILAPNQCSTSSWLDLALYLQEG